MKKGILILLLLLGFLWVSAVKAQDCDCYVPTRQAAMQMMEKKNYAKALKLLRAADVCPDKPESNDLDAKMQECRRAIKKEQERIEAEKNKPATPPNDENSGGEIVIPLVPRQKVTVSYQDLGYDLSARGTANCYVVSKPGTYSFRTKVVTINSHVMVRGISSAEVLWESFGTMTLPSVGDIIRNVSYVDNSESDSDRVGAVVFSTPSILKNGNAVIAVKSPSGKILWSWHIWVCKDYDPVSTAQKYYHNAGTMMDRNLGATSATPGDVCANGLLYQWGRKDPFLGFGDEEAEFVAASSLRWPSPVSANSNIATPEYATEYPTTFIANDSLPYDWCWKEDCTRWMEEKTIYDPCPSGWHIPGESIWIDALGSDDTFSNRSKATKQGMNFGRQFGPYSNIWYPAAGNYSTAGELVLGNYSGDYAGLSNMDFGTHDNCDVYLFFSVLCKAQARSVRCLQE